MAPAGGTAGLIVVRRRILKTLSRRRLWDMLHCRAVQQGGVGLGSVEVATPTGAPTPDKVKSCAAQAKPYSLLIQ